MIEAASARGIGTTINTNFSVPFDRARAERLVAAGLTELNVSVDGAHQATYEQYRVRGDLERVLHNSRLVSAARAPWDADAAPLLEFHVFPTTSAASPCTIWRARTAAAAHVKRASCPATMDTARRSNTASPIPTPCIFCGTRGGVDDGDAAVRGAFRAGDDMTGWRRRRAAPAARFRDVWNGPLRRGAPFYRRRERRGARYICSLSRTQMWSAERIAPAAVRATHSTSATR
jgi:hypothetical protein